MSILPPEDADVFVSIVAVVGRMALSAVLWLERALPIVLPSGFAAYLFGKHFGYVGTGLRLFVVTGVFVSIVGTPVVVSLFGLDTNTWETTVCCALSVFCIKGVEWAEKYIALKLGIDRRNTTSSRNQDIYSRYSNKYNDDDLGI